MHFLFCLDLSLHAGAGKKFGILIFVTEHGLEYKNCLLDATEKSKTIQQYGMLVLSTFFSFLIYFHLLEMIVT